MSKNKIWAIGVSAVMLAAVITGLIFSGSPEQARKYTADMNRVSLLSQAYASIDAYYRTKKALPASLADLQKQPAYYLPSLVDPVTQQPLEYTVTSSNKYQLCATFDLASLDETVVPKYYPYDRASFWAHPAGRYCYDLEAPAVTGDQPALEMPLP